MEETRKPISTKTTQKFTDGSKRIKLFPEPEQEIIEAPEMYKEIIENTYCEPPKMDKYVKGAIVGLCVVVAIGVAIYVLYKEDEVPAPALAEAEQL